MISVIILASIAAVIVAATIVTVLRDGYGRTPDRMSETRLRERDELAAQQNLELRTRAAAAHTVTTTRLA